MKRARLRNRQATHKVGRLVGAELDVDGPSRCEVDGTVETADSAATLCCTPPLNPTEGTGGFYQLVRNEPARRQLGLLSAVLIGLQTKVTNIIYNKLISTTP